MSNIKSNSIRIFPSSNRGVNTSKFGNNFVTEYNLSSIVNKLLAPGVDGFLISTKTEDEGSEEYSGVAEFNIGGYFVSVSSWYDIIQAATSSSEVDTNDDYQNFVTFSKVSDDGYADKEIISASITLRNDDASGGNSDDSYTKIVGNDNVGIDSTVSSDTDEVTISLNLLIKESEKWVLFPDSMLKFTNISIDDGLV